MYNNIFQFKITLKGIKPLIWRRIQVPETYTFWDLHVAIQDAMGWTDTHLHHFEIKKPSTGRKEQIGIPDEDFMDEKIAAGWMLKIADFFTGKNKQAEYIYDYGDDWQHKITLEKILPKKRIPNIPSVLEGREHVRRRIAAGYGGMRIFLRLLWTLLMKAIRKCWIGSEVSLILNSLM